MAKNIVIYPSFPPRCALKIVWDPDLVDVPEADSLYSDNPDRVRYNLDRFDHTGPKGIPLFIVGSLNQKRTTGYGHRHRARLVEKPKLELRTRSTRFTTWDHGGLHGNRKRVEEGSGQRLERTSTGQTRSEREPDLARHPCQRSIREDLALGAHTPSVAKHAPKLTPKPKGRAKPVEAGRDIADAPGRGVARGPGFAAPRQNRARDRTRRPDRAIAKKAVSVRWAGL